MAKKVIQLAVFLIVQIVMVASLHLGPAQADNSKACYDLFRPLEKQAVKIKDRGGIWELFENGAALRKHSTVGLHIDSKTTGLIDTLNYVCESQEGIPLNEVANYVVTTMKQKGREGFVKYYISLSHSIEVVEVWAEYAEYFEANRKRKLDFNLTKKTLGKAQKFFERYSTLAQTIDAANEEELRIKSLGLFLVPLQHVEGIVKEGKALTEDIKQFVAKEPLLKQVQLENSKIPFAPNLSGGAEGM